MKKQLFLSALCVISIFCLDSVCYSQYVIKKISRNPYEDANPKINNNGYVVWEGYDGTDWEIFLYDGIETIQLTDNSYDDFNPQINNNGYVVWEGQSVGGADYEIFLYDGFNTIQLTANSYEDGRPQINDNGYVVWEGQLLGGSNSSEIFLYDGATTIQLTDNSYEDYNPQINNNGYVVWMGADAHNVLQIFLYDGIEIIQLSSGFDDKEYPRINDKGHVVWFVGHAGQYGGIYLGIHRYNGTVVICLKGNRGDENEDPEINNNGHIVWNRWDGHDNEIMLFDGAEIVQLTNNLDNDNEPKINNKGEIAWTRYTTRGPSIIVYNGVTFTELTISSRTASSPQINDHGFVAFLGWDGSDHDIYLASRLSVISPDGGEPVPSGQAYTIRWAGPSQAVKYKVRYSMDNGLTWSKAHQEAFVTGTTLDWNVPVPPANRRKCLVKVIGFDASGTEVGRDQSDTPFTIDVLRLTSPNAGEPPITSGGQHTITWTTNTTVAPVDYIVLSYTLNNGLTWKTIDTTADSVDDGSFIWNVPDVARQKNNCRVKIVVKDAFGNTVGSDVSDGVFTIQPVPLP